MSNIAKIGIAAAGTAIVGLGGYYAQKGIRSLLAKRAAKKTEQQKQPEQAPQTA